MFGHCFVPEATEHRIRRMLKREIGRTDLSAASRPASPTATIRVAHALPALVGQRVFAIALGYEDLVDHDDLRRDPALGAVLGRLAAKPRNWPGSSTRRGRAPLSRCVGHDPA